MKFQIFIYIPKWSNGFFYFSFSLIEDTEAPRSPQHDSETTSLPSEPSESLELPRGLSGPLGPSGTSGPSKPFGPSVQSWIPGYSWLSQYSEPLGPSVFLLLDNGEIVFQFKNLKELFVS